jgi:hypothetical protein
MQAVTEQLLDKAVDFTEGKPLIASHHRAPSFNRRTT